MYDRPTATELLQAAQQHLENAVLPIARAHSHKLYFQTLVAVNVLRIVARETELRSGHLWAEWSRLNMLLGGEDRPDSDERLHDRLQARNAALCAAIRAGEWDRNSSLFEHLKATTIEQLEVANPKFLHTLATEGTVS